jgi:hypothetical protein
MNGETYQLFVLGSLFLEVLTGRPGLVLKTVSDHRGAVNKDLWNQQLQLELKTLPELDEAMRETIAILLQADPLRRGELADFGAE